MKKVILNFKVMFVKSILVCFIIGLGSFVSRASANNSSPHYGAEGNIALWGVSAKHTQFREGAYHQFLGTRKILTFEIGVDVHKLTSVGKAIKRVGFKGQNFSLANLTSGENPVPLELELPVNAGLNQIWSFNFNTEITLMGQSSSSYKGAFFVETTDGTYYWLKTNSGNDFEFGPNSRAELGDY